MGSGLIFLRGIWYGLLLLMFDFFWGLVEMSV